MKTQKNLNQALKVIEQKRLEQLALIEEIENLKDRICLLQEKLEAKTLYLEHYCK